jgi:hypothetical protein
MKNAMSARLIPVLVLAMALIALPQLRSVAADIVTPECGTCDLTRECSEGCCPNQSCCSCCREICCPTVETAKEKKPCWNVNCEKKCVPAIRLPWEPGGSPLTLFNCLRNFGQSDCGATCGACGGDMACCDGCCSAGERCRCGPVRCGTVRAVHVLEEDSYEVERCETKWEIKQVATCRCQCGATHCQDAIDDDASESHSLPPMR